MDDRLNPIINNCNMAGVKPAMFEFPYPPIQVKCRNQSYADLLSMDYCGAVSEMTALTQYVNNESRISRDHCFLAQTILGIAMSEMIHLQKLGELIFLLSGDLDFTATQQNGKHSLWTPSYLNIPDNIEQMICADIDGEKAAINQYRMHMNRIDDEYVNAVVARIIKDEEYHILLLQALLDEVK